MARFPESRRSPTPEQVREMLAEATKPVVRLLEEHGYEIEGWERGPDEFGPATALVLANPRAERKVNLSLAWMEGQPVAEVMIIRTPRQSVQDDLFPSLLVEKTTPSFDTRSLLIDTGKPVQEEIRRVFRLYTELLRGPAAPILRGEAWETGHYTDWTL